MLCGVIFDLGSTLIHNPAEVSDWRAIRQTMVNDLMANLRQQGRVSGDFDADLFSQTFIRNTTDFDAQRQTHFREITADYILRTTLAELNLPIDGIDIDTALAAYFAYSETLWQLIPPAHRILDDLQQRNLRLALVSNASDNANVQRLIDHHGLRPYFDPIIVSAAAGVRKPNPRIFAPVFAYWHCLPSQVVMVGDTLGADILGAKNAGMKSIWLAMHADTPGNQNHRNTILPDATAHSLEELPMLIDQLPAAG